MDKDWTTRNTLIVKVKDPNNKGAWDEFVSFYTSFIHMVLKQSGLHNNYVDDVTQDILLRIWKYFKSYDPDKHNVKFRTWLSRVVRNATYDFYKTKAKKDKMFSSVDELFFMNSSDFSDNELERLISIEWEKHIVELAISNIKGMFSGVAIQVFELSLIGKSRDEIAEALKIKPESVKTLRTRVRKRLTIEIKLLRECQEI